MLGALRRENPLQFQCSFLNSSSQFFLASCSAYFKIGNSSGLDTHIYLLWLMDLKLDTHSLLSKTGGVGGSVGVGVGVGKSDGESVVLSLSVRQVEKQLQNMIAHLDRRGENNSISLLCSALVCHTYNIHGMQETPLAVEPAALFFNLQNSLQSCCRDWPVGTQGDILLVKLNDRLVATLQ